MATGIRNNHSLPKFGLLDICSKIFFLCKNANFWLKNLMLKKFMVRCTNVVHELGENYVTLWYKVVLLLRSRFICFICF